MLPLGIVFLIEVQLGESDCTDHKRAVQWVLAMIHPCDSKFRQAIIHFPPLWMFPHVPLRHSLWPRGNYCSYFWHQRLALLNLWLYTFRMIQCIFFVPIFFYSAKYLGDLLLSLHCMYQSCVSFIKLCTL